MFGSRKEIKIKSLTGSSAYIRTISEMFEISKGRLHTEEDLDVLEFVDNL